LGVELGAELEESKALLDEHSKRYALQQKKIFKIDILDDQKTTDASSGAETSEEKLVAGVSGDVASVLEVQSTSTRS
jgi:hypothetical protein